MVDGPALKRRRLDADSSAVFETLPPTVRELELRARLSASEKRERELSDALEHLSAYLSSASASLLPASDYPIPPTLQPLLHALKTRITHLERENERLRAATRSTTPSHVAQLEAENERLAEALSSGRVAVLEAALKSVDEGSKATIAALEADCDELVAMVKSLRALEAAAAPKINSDVKRSSKAPSQRGSDASSRPVHRDARSSRRSASPKPRSAKDDDRQRKHDAEQHRSSKRDSERSGKREERRDPKDESRRGARKGEPRDERSDASKRDTQRDRNRHSARAPPRPDDRTDGGLAPSHRSPSPVRAEVSTESRGISIRGAAAANGTRRSRR